MPTMKRRDFDAEMAAWMAEVKAHQSDDVTELDHLADLWLANGDAKAIKDPRSPAYDAAHERLNAALSDLGY